MLPRARRVFLQPRLRYEFGDELLEFLGRARVVLQACVENLVQFNVGGWTIELEVLGINGIVREITHHAVGVVRRNRYDTQQFPNV